MAAVRRRPRFDESGVAEARLLLASLPPHSRTLRDFERRLDLIAAQKVAGVSAARAQHGIYVFAIVG